MSSYAPPNRRGAAWAALVLSAVATFVLLPLAPSSAAGPPALSLGGEPVDVRADRVEVDLAKGTAVLEGNVELRRKGLSVHCPRLEASFDPEGKILRAKATAGVVVKLAEKNVRGDADEAEIDLVLRTAELRGTVRVSSGGTTLTAQRATMSLVTSRVTLEAVRGSFAAPSSGAPAPLAPAP